jgi:hypothetical protein
MRAYFFNNMYLNGIHNGIQAGHALDQLWSGLTETVAKLTKTVHAAKSAPARLREAQAKLAMLREFSKTHKTWIILKGGDSDALADLYNFMDTPFSSMSKLFQPVVKGKYSHHSYPFAMFQEPGLNNAITSVCVVLPERMYDDLSTAVGKAMIKADPTLTPQPTINWMLAMPVQSLDAATARNYTPWEREFLKRKALCGLAS